MKTTCSGIAKRTVLHLEKENCYSNAFKNVVCLWGFKFYFFFKVDIDEFIGAAP